MARHGRLLHFHCQNYRRKSIMNDFLIEKFSNIYFLFCLCTFTYVHLMYIRALLRSRYNPKFILNCTDSPSSNFLILPMFVRSDSNFVFLITE